MGLLGWTFYKLGSLIKASFAKTIENSPIFWMIPPLPKNESELSWGGDRLGSITHVE